MSKKLHCPFSTDYSAIPDDAQIIILAIKDAVVEEIAGKLNAGDKLVVHVSGSLRLDAVMKASKNYGVFYPLQSFLKERKVNFREIPICIEANNAKSGELLKILGSSISNNVQLIDSEKRKTLHVAAVFACNFSNHLYAIAEVLLQQKGLSFDMLVPLVTETAKRTKLKSPRLLQTGPAARGDKKIILEHLEYLKNLPDYMKIYELMTRSIESDK